MTKQGLIELWLVTRRADDRVTSSKLDTAKNMTQAMKKAKKLAGRGAKFVVSQGRCEYRGPNGTIYIGV